MKSEKLAVLIADGDREYGAEMIARLQRQGQRIAVADAGGSCAAGDRSLLDEEIQTSRPRGELSRGELDIVIVALEVMHGDPIRRGLARTSKGFLGGQEELMSMIFFRKRWGRRPGSWLTAKRGMYATNARGLGRLPSDVSLITCGGGGLRWRLYGVDLSSRGNACVSARPRL